MRVVGRWPLVVGREKLRKLRRLLIAVFREIFDECAWDRYSARHADHKGTFADFLRERHGRPRQRCC